MVNPEINISIHRLTRVIYSVLGILVVFPVNLICLLEKRLLKILEMGKKN